jgi:crossover junction endodeoxyribonuclease RuvC
VRSLTRSRQVTRAGCGPQQTKLIFLRANATYEFGVSRAPIRILGIDPGLRRTGWGVVGCEGNRLAYVACGSVTTDGKASLADRLVAIHVGLSRIVDEFRPDEAAVESTFVNRDAVATLKLGQARGIALLVPAQAGLVVAEYAPNLVKKTIVGAGHGDKRQIRMMVGVLLPRADPQSDDAADALAIAVTHAHHRTSPVVAEKLAQALERKS